MEDKDVQKNGATTNPAMKITVFTSNQPRHLAFIRALAGVANQVTAVIETKSVFPAPLADGAMTPLDQYFARMRTSEERIFGKIGPCPDGVRVLALPHSELSQASLDVLGPALEADRYFTFGCSYIRGDLCSTLIQKKAINLHIGVSPQFRGSACNFWALEHGRADLVGATVHRLAAGLDSGAILFHTFPAGPTDDPFDLGMLAVQSAIEGTIHHLSSDVLDDPGVEQDRSQQIYYSRNKDFTAELAQQFLIHPPARAAVEAQIKQRNVEKLIRPFVGSKAAGS